MPKGVYKRTEEGLKNMSLSHVGKQTKNKNPHWKGGQQTKHCLNCKTIILVYPYQIKIGEGKYCSKKCSSVANRGVIFCTKTLFKKGQFSGDKHPNWKGGITPLRRKIRNLDLYANWRASIFQRDNYTCKLCGKTKCLLHADHYPLSFSKILNENNILDINKAINCQKFWNIDNGRTLCIACHAKTDNYGHKY